MSSSSDGFCEQHGPFDASDLMCPYCALEDDQRRTYGPPANPSFVASEEVALSAEPAHEPDEPEPRDPASDRTVWVPHPSEPAANSLETEADEHADQPGALGWLIVKEPAEQRGTVLLVQANQTIGRQGEIQWDDPRLSRQHARLTLEPPADTPEGPAVFHLWPFGPMNPVYINAHEIRGATPLMENDEIRLGHTLFVFKVLMD